MAQDVESTKKRNWFKRHKLTSLILGIFLLIIIFSVAGGASKDNPTTTTSTSTTDTKQAEPIQPEKPKFTATPAGTYKIGKDLAAGEYRLIADNGSGYISISKDSTGSFESIVTNAIVTVTSGQYFTINRANAYPIDASPDVNTKEQGTFKVGKDIQPGEYKIASDGSGYLEVTSDSTGSFGSIVTNNNFDADTYITVTNGQYLILSRSHIKS
jgi:hypothetical protein